MCSKPYREGVMEYGCGQCLPCRINRRRLWTGRLMLETHLHAVSAFVTLTYDNEHVPSELIPRDLQLFLKRLRKRMAPEKLRFYGVGEYGDISGRPHFHVIVFGLGGLVVGRHDRKCSCVVCASWSKGLCHIGEVTPESAGYTVSYTLKRMTKFDDPRLKGKHPEFARMSLRPGGIGHGAVSAILDGITTKGGADYVCKSGDVPGRIRSVGKMWPLGRYLLSKVRSDYGFTDRALNDIKATVGRVAQEAMKEKGARELRESKRIQAARRAYSLYQISRSKKGIGV